MTQSREKRISLLVSAAIVADGVQVPPGTYAGLKRELGVSYMGKIVWQSPEYLLDVPGKPGDVYLSTQVDVTQHIAHGTVAIK